MEDAASTQSLPTGQNEQPTMEERVNGDPESEHSDASTTSSSELPKAAGPIRTRQQWSETNPNLTWYEKQHSALGYQNGDGLVTWTRSGRKRPPLDYSKINIKSLLGSAEDLRDHPPALPESEKDAWISSWPCPLPESAKELIELIREQHCQVLVRFADLRESNPNAIAGLRMAAQEQFYYFTFRDVARMVGCNVPTAYFADTYVEDIEDPAFPYYEPGSFSD